MNIHEISLRHNIPLVHLRKLVKAKLLKADLKDDSDGARIRHQLQRNPGLTVAQAVTLTDNPDLLEELMGYRERVTRQLATLGNIRGDAAPVTVAANVTSASQGDVDAARVIGAWLREIIPAGRPINHLWIASRLLFNQPAQFREDDIKRSVLALMHVRALPEMEGWWTSVAGAKRNTTLYHNPKKALDL